MIFQEEIGKDWGVGSTFGVISGDKLQSISKYMRKIMFCFLRAILTEHKHCKELLLRVNYSFRDSFGGKLEGDLAANEKVFSVLRGIAGIATKRK